MPDTLSQSLREVGGVVFYFLLSLHQDSALLQGKHQQVLLSSFANSVLRALLAFNITLMFVTLLVTVYAVVGDSFLAHYFSVSYPKCGFVGKMRYWQYDTDVNSCF